ncbi:MAG: pantetheine-phosphate adenylyltransferase [Oscillospiraceae bacterium]|nr:pantetheine-phosphate adenylyltransferase [Oscillospiraceae bacterium]
MKTAIYPGSFDPVTNGHLDIIKRAATMFDKLIVVVLINPFKNYSFTIPERVKLLSTVTENIRNVEIDSYDGLLADYFKDRPEIDVIVKGLRATSDFEYEFQMAHTNKDLNPRAETVFIPASATTTFISSSMVKQVAMFGGDLSNYVPAEIHGEISAKLTAEFAEKKRLADIKRNQ